MYWNRCGSLSVLLVFPLVLAGGSAPSPEAPWLGREVQIEVTAYCHQYGCVQTGLRQYTPGTMGGPDGRQVTYRLRSGAELNLDVRVVNTPPRSGRWVSNARLSLPGLGKTAGTADLRLAADFYRALTGRPFHLSSVRACLAAAEADPDIEGGNILISNWTTPDQLPYRARCGRLRSGFPQWPRFWVGWMQQ